VTDLALTGGRVLDPGRGIDARLDVGVTAGRVSAIGDAGRPPREAGRAGETIDARGLVLVPGLIDLHTHLYSGVSHYGIDPDAHCLRRGVTTAVDAGSAGAQTFPGFRRYVIEPADTRVFAFLHVAVQGMITSLVGELEDLRWASPDQAVARAREHPDLIVGVKVRLGYQMVGNDPEPALRLARQAAGRLSAAASWLDERNPGDLLTGIRALARMRPGLVLAGAAFAGLVVGRLTRRLPGGRRARERRQS